MTTILQFALAALSRLDLTTLRRIWNTIERLVSGLELARFKDNSMSGAEKLAYVIDRVMVMIPEKRKEVGAQIIRAIVEIVLIGLRLRGGAK
jgi:hypothetical protein